MSKTTFELDEFTDADFEAKLSVMQLKKKETLQTLIKAFNSARLVNGAVEVSVSIASRSPKLAEKTSKLA